METAAGDAIATVRWPLFVAGRIQNNQCKNVYVPHAIDTGEECRCEFQMHGIIQPVLRLVHLSDNETGDG